MFSFGTFVCFHLVSYKLSKIIHIMILQLFKGLFAAFSLRFMRFTLSLYTCCSELSASQDPRTRVFYKLNIPCIIARRVLTLSRY